LADQNFRVKHGIGIGTNTFVDANRNIDAGIGTIRHVKVTGIATVGIISAVDGNGAQGIVTFQSRIGISSNGNTITIAPPSAGAGITQSYEIILPPGRGTDGQVLTMGINGQLGFTTAGLYESRFYVSAANGDDSNDGRAKPVKTIKRAAQLASFRSFNLPPGRYIDAGNLLQLNKTFIQNEVVSYLEFNYPNLSIDKPDYDRDICIRDVGFILDAIIYDISYGGNSKTVEAALAYWENGTSYVDGEVEEALFAYQYISFLGQYVINNQTPPTLYQTAVPQSFNFDIIDDPENNNNNFFHRRKDARNLIVANRQEIIDKSLAAVALNHPDFSFPGEDSTNTRSRYYDSYRLIQQNRQTIIDYAYAGISSAYPSFSDPNPDKCKRDLGFYVDAISTDVFTGGNNYAREFVIKYFTGTGAGSLSGEEQETIYAYQYAGTLMKEAITNQLPVQDLTLTADPVTGSNTDPASCADVQSNIDNLVGIVTTVIGAGNTSGIAAANFGYFAGITTSCNVICGSIGIGSTNIIGGRKCARDLGYIVDAVAQDVSYGSNQHIVYATKKYFDGVGAALTTGLFGEEQESITAFQALRDYAKKAIANQLNSQDLTIIADPITGFNTDPGSCANIQTNIDNLVGILTVAIGNSSLSSVPASNLGQVTDCADVRSAVNSYVGIITSVIGIGITAAPNVTLPSTLSEPIAIIVEAGDYVEDNPILLYEDIAVLGDNLRNTIVRPANGGRDLFRVRNGCYVSNFAMKDFVDPAGVPQYTFDNAVAFDDPDDTTTSRVGYAAKATKTTITRSPYVQNCSILSFLGANGILVDGSKVLSPNVPFIPEEAENPVVDAQPEQGKSMVAAAFTMVSFGGIGWRCINEGYAQVVSCFQIFCKYGSLCQSGGYLSITNSATNFGLYALRSIGWSPNSFRFDRGRIAATGISGGLQTLKVIGVGRTDQDLYVLRFYNNANVDQTSSFKPITVQQQFDATTGISTASDRFLITNHPFSNGDTVLYIADEGAIPPRVIGGLVGGNQYYLSYIDQNTFELYEDDSLTRRVNLTSTVVGIHTLQKGNLEFFVNEMLDTHGVYQSVGLATDTLNFVPGRQVSQTVPGGTAVGFALTFLSNTRQLIVSVESSAGVRRLFGVSDGSTFLNILDHSGSPVSAAVTGVTGISTYRTVEFKVDSTPSGTVISNVASLPENYQLFFHRPSIVNSSSHTWEYSGSGTDYNALPQNGGQTRVESEQVFELGGRVFSSGTNELGDFKIGTFITAFNRTGNIIFNNKVTIGVLESLRLSLSGGVAIEAFSTDVGLGDNEVSGPQDSKVSTQKAVRTFLNNRLGNFIDRNLTTNAVPNGVVQLNAIGQINADLIPPKVVNYYRANVSGGRTDLVNLIPATNLQNGDTVIEPGNGYVLISDVFGQYLILSSDTQDYNFNNEDVVISANSAGGAIGIVTTPPVNAVGYGTTGLVKGVLLGATVTNGGSGYTNPGIYTCVVDTNTGIGTSARAAIEVGAGGTVTRVTVNFGGRYYAIGDTFTINDDDLIGGRSGGSRFSATVSNIETRLYLQLTNNQKFTGSVLLPDYISDGNAVAISTDTSVELSKTFNPTDVSVGGDVDFANDRILVSNSGLLDGDPVIYSSNGGNIIGGLTQNITYYIKRVGITSVELYNSYALASKIDLSSSGTGTASITRVGVNTQTEQIIFANHGYTTGDSVKTSGTTPTGIATDAYYFVGSVTTNSLTLHQTRADALVSVNGLILNPVGIADTNGGTFSLTEQNVTYSATINTSSAIFDNWTVLSSASIDASNITTGTISPARLGAGNANDTTFLAGDSSYKKVITSVGIGTTQPLSATGTTFDGAPGGIGINTYYGKVELRVNRASGTGDLYSTLGVAKFKTSTFAVDADGAVSIKPSSTGDIDAATLGGVSGAFFLDPANFTGNIPISRGGTGLSALPSLGAILQGNGLGYDLVTAPTFYGNVTITNNGRLNVAGIAATNISVTGATGIATFQNFRVTNEVVSGVSTFSGTGNNINQTAGTAALNRLTVTGITTVSTLFFESLGGTSGATIPFITNTNTVHTGIVTFTSSGNNIQQQAGTAELNNLTVAGVSTFVSLTNFGTANFGTVNVTGTLDYANSQTAGVSTFSGSGNNINQTNGTAALNRLTVAGVTTVSRLQQASNETAALQRLTVAGVSTFSGQLNAGTISATNFTGALNNTLTIQSPLTGNSYNNSAAVTLGINATSANTANFVVQRGSAGEISVGIISATGGTFTGALNVAPSTNLSFGNQTRQMLNLWSTAYGLGVQSSTLYFRSDSRFSWHRGGSHNDAENNPGGGAVAMTLDGSSNLAVTGTVQGTRLISTIATGTAPLTVSSTTQVTNLNASLLEGYSTDTANTANRIVRRDGSGNFTSNVVTVNQLISTNNGNGTNVRIGDDCWVGDINVANTFRVQGVQNADRGFITFGNSSNTQLGRIGTGALTWGGETIWHSGNDGTGSTLDADLLDGLQLNSTTVNNQANTVVRTEGNGYTYFGWINSISGELGDWGNGTTRYTASNDQFLRYLTRNSMKVQLGLTGKYDADRRDFTTDTNYFVGSMGWGTTNMNSVFDWGSGFIDSWDNPANQPSGTSHWVGVQALHNTNGTNRYGWQMVGGPVGNLRFRNTWPTFSAWRTIPVLDVNNNNGGALYAGIYYDANDTNYYVDPASNGTRAGYLNGNLWINPKSESYGEGITFNMPSQGTWGGLRWYRNGPAGGFAGNWAFGYFGNESNNDIGFHNGTNGWRLDQSFNMTSTGSVRAPIFYDSNNTAFYADPASTSIFNQINVTTLNVNGTAVTPQTNATYSLPNTAGASGWIRLGTYATAQSGRHLLLRIVAGTGYNANAAQNCVTFVHFKTSNGSSNVGGFYGDGYKWIAAGASGAPSTVRIVQVNLNSYEVWGNFGSFTGDGSHYHVTCGGGSWTHSGTNTGATAPTGTFIDLGNLTVTNSFGDFTATSSARAPIFYDSNDTAFYTDPASTSITNDFRATIFYIRTDTNSFWNGNNLTMRGNNPTITLRDTDNNTGYIHCNSNLLYILRGANDAASGAWAQVGGQWPFIFNLTNNDATCGRDLYAVSSHRAPIFYDSNDTNYYIDPASSSLINGLETVSSIFTRTWLRFNGTGSYGIYWHNTGMTGYNWHIYPLSQADMRFRTGAGNGGIVGTIGDETARGYIHWTTSNEIGFLNSARSWSLRVDNSGNTFATSSHRAPIFYDSNNTAFYLDPNAGLSIRTAGSWWQNSVAWQGDPGNGVGKIEYHSERWYIVSGANSNEVCRWRRSATDVMWLANNGNLTVSGTVTANSDIRLKDNVEIIENALEKVSQIRGVTFTRNDQDDKEKRHAGVIAQEVEKVLPEIVHEDENGIKSVAYGNMVSLLIEAIKEQNQTINKLQEDLTQLKSKFGG
jgi:hypothetical protein